MTLGQAMDTGAHSGPNSPIPGIWSGKVVGQMDQNIQPAFYVINSLFKAGGVFQPFSNPFKQIGDLQVGAIVNLVKPTIAAIPLGQGKSGKGPIMMP